MADIKLPPCPGCGVSPTWSTLRPGCLRFACACNGLDLEIPKGGAPSDVIDKIKETIERAHREEYQAFVSKVVFCSPGRAQ